MIHQICGVLSSFWMHFPSEMVIWWCADHIEPRCTPYIVHIVHIFVLWFGPFYFSLMNRYGIPNIQFARGAAAIFFCDRFDDLQKLYFRYLRILLLRNLVLGTVRVPNTKAVLLISAGCYAKSRIKEKRWLFQVHFCNQNGCWFEPLLLFQLMSCSTLRFDAILNSPFCVDSIWFESVSLNAVYWKSTDHPIPLPLPPTMSPLHLIVSWFRL